MPNLLPCALNQDSLWGSRYHLLSGETWDGSLLPFSWALNIPWQPPPLKSLGLCLYPDVKHPNVQPLSSSSLWKLGPPAVASPARCPEISCLGERYPSLGPGVLATLPRSGAPSTPAGPICRLPHTVFSQRPRDKVRIERPCSLLASPCCPP